MTLEESSSSSSSLEASNALKAAANALFIVSNFEDALSGYERALIATPADRNYEQAVIRSNMAACAIRMEDWEKAIDEGDKGMEELDVYEGKDKQKVLDDEVNVQEVADEKSTEEILKQNTNKNDDTQRIRMKLLLRRAKGKMEKGGWQSLQSAKEDYTALLTFEKLSSSDRKTIQSSLKQIDPKMEKAKEQEMGEMMGKLKDLGNGILKPFGLSTDNFNMVKDEKTGGYNLKFS